MLDSFHSIQILVTVIDWFSLFFFRSIITINTTINTCCCCCVEMDGGLVPFDTNNTAVIGFLRGGLVTSTIKIINYST